jgi:DNA recombination protein RmuC
MADIIKWCSDNIGILCALNLLLLAIVAAVYFAWGKTLSRMFKRGFGDAEKSKKMLIDIIDSTTQNSSRRHLDAIGHLETAVLGAVSDAYRNEGQRIDALGGRFDLFNQTQEIRQQRMIAVLDDKLTQNEQRIERMRETLQLNVSKMQTDNAQKLEEMRLTVDEKLHDTLDKRLGESFSLVNERLEQVYKGLGEMQNLANGVGDLKRVLTNVKTRGTWGEVQLGALLEQILAKAQYEENISVVPGSSERVEYAVRLPGQGEGKSVFLPIDAKFPMDAYVRLLTASESGDAEAVSVFALALQASVRNEAKRISRKYIAPPYTTDFAIMFLATEGLYSETLRSRGLVEELQMQHRIVIAGPTTLTALLNSLQIGFKTLAIEKRSSEVWQLLGAVKTEFSRYGQLLEQTQKRLAQASDSIQNAHKSTQKIERRLREVEALSSAQSMQVLGNEAEEEVPVQEEPE